MNVRLYLFISVIILGVLVASCSGKNGDMEDAIALGVSATQTKAAWEAEMESARKTEEANISAGVTPEAVVHIMLPGEPSETSNTYVTDFNSIDFAYEGFTYSDQYLINRYERPFTIDMEEYRGYLDIILANMKVNPPWIYVDVFFADIMPETNLAKYAIEFDVDEDGRGDYLVEGVLPDPGEWTVLGVNIYEDNDNDVGGELPHIPDVNQTITTGYESVLFESGQGDDPDLAWIRRNPDDDTSLQFAIKIELVGEQGFLWSVWADEGLMDLELQEYNDIFDFEEAGSPFPEHEFHPIQAINLVDNTCISWYAYEPVGDEIGLCQVYYETGPEKGWKICYNSGKTIICQEECMVTCPRWVAPPYSCEQCTMPSSSP